jgi:hypothetical protein
MSDYHEMINFALSIWWSLNMLREGGQGAEAKRQEKEYIRQSIFLIHFFLHFLASGRTIPSLCILALNVLA